MTLVQVICLVQVVNEPKLNYVVDLELVAIF